MRVQLLSPKFLTTSMVGFFVLAISALPSPSHAKDEERGRLADGRAFRTDGEGNQLVDYIAELEVTAEALQTQVQGLESELKEKNAKLTVLEEQQGCAKPLTERALTATQAAPANVTRCETEHTRINQLVALLESAREDLVIERQLSVKREEEAKRTEHRLRLEIEDRSKRLESLSGELTLARAELQNLQKQLSAPSLTVVRAQVLPEARAALKPESAPSEVTVPSGVTVQSTGAQAAETQTISFAVAAQDLDASRAAVTHNALVQARGRAVEVVRSRMRTEINQLKGLIASRDKAFRNYNRSATSVSFRPQPVVSDSGMSLSEIEKRLETSSTVSEVARLGRDISQIRSRMNEDIALLKRMGR
jgi:predicted  nucleic acid-binding Zn-ribbon protein